MSYLENTSRSLYFHAVFFQLAAFESTNAGKYLIFYSKFNEQEGRKYRKAASQMCFLLEYDY